MRPKLFLSLWNVRRKPCTYLASRLAISPNGPNVLPLEPHHLGVPSGVSKIIFEPMVRSAQTVHLYCTNTNTISKWTERDSTCPTSPRSSIGCIQNDIWASRMLSANLHLSYITLTPSPNGPNEIPHVPHHLGVPSGASKMISEPLVRLAQTMHLPYINTNTISKWSERDSTWPTSPRSSIGCVQIDFWFNGTFDANHAPILHWH